ncbi:MAG: leucine--tRNA ligase, partial [Planctomycetes bacterium]|nr:leucine--tRNA ligase [Planctomycetota bacterium]
MNQSTSTDTTEQPRSDHDRPFRYSGRLAGDIELRWQARWEKEQTFRALNPGDEGFDASKPKFYCLDMFPYPSGAGLHVGHPEGYTATDIVCRYKRMKGFNVLHPMGYDAFGLPAEQYAIQTGVHPAITTRTAIKTFTRQLRRFGFSYDWSRQFATIDEDYYRWTQWIWLKAYDAWFDPETEKARHIDELIEKYKNDPSSIRMNPNHTLQRAGAWMERWVDTSSSDPWQHYLPFQQRAIIDSWRLVYLSNQTVNWCPKLGTALANEEVIDGRSEVGNFPVFKKPLKQWMFRITAFAERLLEDLDSLDWPDSTRTMQTAWIGRSEGAHVDFPLIDPPLPDDIASLRVFTTRPDTLFGATYMVLAPEHPLVEQILAKPCDETNSDELAAYVDQAKNRSDVDRMIETKEKTGVFTGLYAINPAIDQDDPLWVNQHRIPIWVADYVLMGYGTGAIMAVPSHDQRDLDFSRAFDITTQNVVMPSDDWLRKNVTEAFKSKPIENLRDLYSTTNAYFEDNAYSGTGLSIKSSNADISLDGMDTPQAKQLIIEWLEKTRRGKGTIQYKLRDWLFSRQRYWGEPFPVVFDEEGNHYPIAAENLPVVLPEMEDFKPTESDDPQPLLGKATHWVNTTAGEAGVDAKVLPPDTPVTRETNTMPQWAGSCWYYLRFCDPRNPDRFVSRDAEKYWMGDEGVDLYIGGAEHAVLHLLYA